MGAEEPLIQKHGGYRNLKTFQIGRLIYDVTVRFCDLYIDIRSRTHDQMVQAARSGVQNIAEGSKASGTSKKMELKLTNVARASLEELKLDYEDFLRQRGLPQLEPDHPALKRFKTRRCSTLKEVQDWARKERERAQEHGRMRRGTDEKAGADGDPSVSVGGGPCESVSYRALAANAALSLLNLCCYLLERQVAAQAEAFGEEGGFTERMYRVRKKRRNRNQQNH